MKAHSYRGGAVSDEERAALLDEGRRCSDPDVKCDAIVGAMMAARTEADLSSDSDELDAALLLLDEPSRVSWYTDDRNNMLAKLLRFADPPRAESAARALLTGGWEDGGRVRLAVLFLDAGRGAEAAAVTEPLADTERHFVGESTGWQSYALAIRADAARALGDLDTALTLAGPAFGNEMDAETAPWETAQVLADVHRSRGELSEALSVLDRAAARMPGTLNDAGASILWRRSVIQPRLGRAEPDPDALDRAIEVLAAAGPLLGVRDLLACAIERAVRVVDDDPAYAARLLGWVAANRRDWVLPFGMNDEIEPLRARLLPTHQVDYDSAVAGDPLPGNRSG